MHPNVVPNLPVAPKRQMKKATSDGEENGYSGDICSWSYSESFTGWHLQLNAHEGLQLHILSYGLGTMRTPYIQHSFSPRQE